MVLCTTLNSIAELPAKLGEFEQFRAAKRVFSAIPEVQGNVDLNQTADAHDLDNLDFVVYPGEFAVAENGAVWLTDRKLETPGDILSLRNFWCWSFDALIWCKTMHEAYERAKPPRPGFGLFLSGPSKTADIEQSLVIGAHGCRELQVYIVP